MKVAAFAVSCVPLNLLIFVAIVQGEIPMPDEFIAASIFR